MINNRNSFLLWKGCLSGVLLLFIITFPKYLSAQDTLLQLAVANPSTPEIESSKSMLEQKLSARSREQLYREIFGVSPPKLPQQIEASLTVNERVDGRIEVVFSEDRSDFTIPSAPVINMISEMMEPNQVQLVRNKIDGSGKISQISLNTLGLKTTFDSQDYLVHIFIPPEKLSKQIHNLKGFSEDPYITETIKPHSLSAYLNFNLKQQFKYMQNLIEDSTNIYSRHIELINERFRQPLYVTIDGAVNIKGTVLEGSAFHDESSSRILHRKDTRLVYDRPKEALRFTAGDLRNRASGYLPFIQLGGLSLAKDYSLKPHVRSYPVSEKEFFLSDPAEVEVWVNNVMVKKMILEPGTHDIRGFPFATGSNFVRIEIRDFAGNSETLEFTYIYEPTLMAKGISQYSYNLGFPAKVAKQSITYDTERPSFAMDYKRGITDNFTFDLYGHLFTKRGIAGTEALFALPFGNLQIACAGSYDSLAGIDFAARAGFFYRSKVSYSKEHSNSPRRTNPIIWNTQAEYIGSNFLKSLQDTVLLYKERAKFTTDLTLPLPEQFNIGLLGKYHLRKDTSDLFEVGVRFQKTWLKSLRTGVSFNYSSDLKTNRANPAVTAYAQWSIISGPNSFSLSERVTRQPPPPLDTFGMPSLASDRQWGFNTDVQWDYIDMNARPEKMGAGAAARIGPDYSDYNGYLSYSGNRGSIEFNQNLAEPGFARGYFLQHRSDFNIKTALVYVDKTVSLSRPVYGGFAMAKGVKNLNGSTIRINPNDMGYDATSSWFGPAVLPLPSQYQLEKIHLAPLNSSVATISEQLDYKLFPQYKSGFLLTLGTDKTILVIGTLLDNDGNPFGHQSIMITAQNDKGSAPTKTFTNQAGKFQFLGKSGQTYEIRPDGNDEAEPALVKIPKSKDDYFRAGELTIGEKPAPDSLPVSLDSLDTVTDSSVSEISSPAVVPFTDEPDTTTEQLRVITFVDTTDSVSEEFKDEEYAKDLVDPGMRRSYVIGVLKGPKEKLSHTAFEVTAMNDSTMEPIQSVTDEKGNFRIILTQATQYKVNTVLSRNGDTVTLGSATFGLADTCMGFHHWLGTITLSAQKEVTGENRTSLNTDSLILLTGTATDQNGKILSYTPITVSSLDETRRTFTDKNGTFQMVFGESGRYMVLITGSSVDNGTMITIPENTRGLFDIGKLKLEKAELEIER